MKVSLRILALLIIGFSLNAHAAIEGNWIGWADWKYQGDGPKCSAHMSFSETADTFTFKTGFLDCDIITVDIPERVFTKINDELFLENSKVGKWNSVHYEWTERYNERTVINVSIDVEGSHLDYKEQWIQDENTLLYDITGRLFKNEPNR